MDGPEEDGPRLEREVHVSTTRGGLSALATPVIAALGMVALGMVALGFAAPTELVGQAGRTETREGNRLYEEGRYAEAHEKYLEALLEAPDSPIIRFNDGNALYQGQDYESALESFRAAVESGDPQLASAAWYNLGNTLYRQGALPESLEAFKQALRADPADVDAKHNLERVLEQMQQQQQEQQQGDGEDDQENQQENEGQPPPQGGEQEQEQDPQDQQPQQDPNEDPEDQQDPNQGQNPQPDPGQNPDEPEQPREGGTPPPGEMTREEAERLLDAIQEDQDEVNRQPRVPARGTRPRRDW